MSGILKYFQVVKKTEQSTLSNGANLPEPNGPLSKVIPSPAISAANKKVSATNNAKMSATRGAYLHFTGAQKYQVGKRAAEFGSTSTLRYYARHYPDLPLKETSMRHFKNQYLEDLKSKNPDDSKNCSDESEGDDDKETVPELPNKKMGRPLLIGEQADRQVQEYIRFLRATGSAVNTVVVISAAEGILESIDANILQRVKLNKDWAKSLLT